MPYLLAIGSALASVIGFIIKHPFVQKMMIFSLFVALIGSATSYMLSLVQPYIVANTVLQIAALFGVIEAITLYLVIVVAGFGVKQVLAFVRSS